MMKTLLIILLGCITSVNADWDACSSRLCQCDRYVAKCDDLNLTYIPTFPQRIQTVLFRNNHLPHINATTFTNLTGLYLLNLYIIFNGIKKIDNDSFTNLSPLEGLDLSGNIFTTRSLFDFIHIVSTTKVKKIILRYIGLTNIPNDLFTGYRTFPVKKLDFSRNQIQIFNYSIFKPITQLQLLDVRENRIAKVILDVGLNLEYLSLSNNNLRDLPDLCREMRYFPKLNTLQLQNNSINTFIPDNLNCIRRLMRLDLSLNGLDAIKTGDFHAFQSLNLLYVSSQRNPKSPLVIEDRAFNNSNLFAIYLHKNLLLSTRIHKNAFLGCTHLKKLDISENFFSDNLEKLIRQSLH
ncbi:fibromodulin [Patella vulgata]|uniref:fibromodulin n=1 Tax=Patella vulgata TaxID=6465 RepID=UPI00217FDD15|nr:fibromodulin [Patella vulgata]XP_050400583.1 fibromodulin [Patella vulgata]